MHYDLQDLILDASCKFRVYQKGTNMYSGWLLPPGMPPERHMNQAATDCG